MGRIVTLNGFPSVGAAQQALRGLLRIPKATRQYPSVPLLASASEMSPPNYLADHSLHFLGRAILQKEAPREREHVVYVRALRPLRDEAYLCGACIRADLQSFGMPYWHVDHQLPGNLWCVTHDCPLSYVPNTDAFFKSPSTVLACSLRVDPRWLAALKGREVIERFVSVQRSFLEQFEPLSSASVADGLLDLARTQGLHSERGTRRMPFSDYLTDRVDSQWVRMIVPTIRARRDKVLLQQMDLSIANGHAAGIAYMLLFSVLHEHASSAIDNIRAAAGLQPKQPAPKQALSIVDLRHAYSRANGNYSEVARLLQMPMQEVGRRLHDLGLPSLSTQTSISHVRLAVERFVGQRQSISNACRGLEVTPAALEDLLRSTARNMNLSLRAPAPAARERVRPPHLP